jgi:hypothetical protein
VSDLEAALRRNLAAHDRDYCGHRGAQHDAHDLAVALRAARERIAELEGLLAMRGEA